MNKKFIAFFLAACMLFAVAGCAGSGAQSSAAAPSSSAPSQASSAEGDGAIDTSNVMADLNATAGAVGGGWYSK